MKKFGPSSNVTSAIVAMVLRGTFRSCSIISFFVVYLVASFTNGISNPISISLNEKSSIALNFRILWDIDTPGDTFNCGGLLFFISSRDMNLHWLFAVFLIAYFLMLLLSMVSSLMGEGPYVLPPQFMFLSVLTHSWIRIPELYIAWGLVPLGVSI